MKDLIITINANTRNALFTRNFIGVNGEYLDGYIKVDFEDEFINGNAVFELERSDGKYLIGMEKGDDNYYYLQIKSSLLSKAEKLYCQIRVDQAGEEIFKCRRFPLYVLTAVNSTATIPDDYGDWLSNANRKLAEVDVAIEDAETATANADTATERANTISQDLETKRDNDYYRGETGNGIASIEKTGTAGLVDTYTITFTDGTTKTYTVTNGAKGDTGNGIASVQKTGTSGIVDTYTITFTDGTTYTYTVTNADNGTFRAEIDEINSKIPAQASANNKLVDTDKMNSSIATNTANFIGTFANVTALRNYAGTVTNNDYAFVQNSVLSTDFADVTSLNAYDKTLLTNFDYAWVVNGTNFDLYRFDITTQTWSMKAQNVAKADVTLNTAFNRYKATVSGSTTTWAYEFTLNNSSFTASQWATIQSGLTSADKTKLDGIEAGAEVNVQADWNESDNNADDYIKNKPTIPTVNNPTITITQGGVTKGSFTLNQSTGDTIALDAGGGSSTDVQVDDVSQVVNGVANLKTKNGNYNASTNKFVTESDVPTPVIIETDTQANSSPTITTTQFDDITDAYVAGKKVVVKWTQPQIGSTYIKFYDVISFTRETWGNAYVYLDMHDSIYEIKKSSGSTLSYTRTYYAKIDGNNTFSGTNNFTGTLQKNGVNVATVNDIPTDYVDTSSNQSIGGTKNFTGTLQIGGTTVSDFVVEQGTGYIRYNSGIQIVWQRVQSNITGAYSITFPKAFKSGTRPAVSATFEGASSTSNYYSYVIKDSLSNTGCQMKGANGNYMSYIAFGVWK